MLLLPTLVWIDLTRIFSQTLLMLNKDLPLVKVYIVLFVFILFYFVFTFLFVLKQDVDGKSYAQPITKLSPLLADDKISKEAKLRLLMTFVMSESGVQVCLKFLFLKKKV
jgi:hypothetical protein